MIEELLVHAASILTVTAGTQDAYGIPAESTTTTPVSCRFYRGGITREGLSKVGSGDHVWSGIVMLVQPTVSIAEGDQVSTTEPAYAGTYRVILIKTRVSDSGLNHIQAFLEEVE
jgi:hypothetical protein